MKILLNGVECADKYVYFDGHVIPVTADGVNIEGWHSHHQLDFAPHIAALSDPAVRDGLPGSPEDWQNCDAHVRVTEEQLAIAFSNGRESGAAPIDHARLGPYARLAFRLTSHFRRKSGTANASASSRTSITSA
jgi:hypothetical protein